MKKFPFLCLIFVLGCQGRLAAEHPTNNDTSKNNGTDLKDVGDSRDSGNKNPDAGTDMGFSETANPNKLDQEALFVCSAPSPPEGRLRRITRHDWTRTVGGQIGSAVDKNPFDPLPKQNYSTYAIDESINPSILEIYLETLPLGAYAWTHRRSNIAGAIHSNFDEASIACAYVDSERPDDNCLTVFVTHLLERGVLFRPPTNDEVTALLGFANARLDAEVAGERAHTLQLIVSAAWLTTGAIFRTELGSGAPDAQGREKLGDWELANAIAYALDGRPAGSPGVYARFGIGSTAGEEGHMPLIRQAAIDGNISDPQVIETVVKAYFGGRDPSRRDLWRDHPDNRILPNRGEFWMGAGVRTFFQEWLGYLQVATTFKDSPWETSAFGSEVGSSYGNLLSGYYGYQPTLIQEMDDMIARIVANDVDVLKELLTSRRFFLAPTTPYVDSSISKSTVNVNHIYNHTELVDAGQASQWIDLPATERAGVLTHPAWLAAHALAFENDPNVVHRGKWIREQLLCGIIPDVPITVEAAFDPNTRDQSARQRMTEQVESRAECGSCHTLMNPLGLPFEIYNHAGFLRESDHGGPPDGSATLVNMPDPALNVAVADAVELTTLLGNSDYAKRCFIRQSFRYFSGRDETQNDACTLSAMESAYDSEGSFSDMLVALFQSEGFQYRVNEVTE